jgi:hypothetical protein
MPERTGRFRVYRVVEAVPHINLVDVDASRLYTVFQSGYPDDRQATVDALRTGDLIEATLSGAPDRDDEPWRLEALDRIGGVEMDFAVDVDPPRVATDLWDDGLDRPARATLEETPEDGPVAEVYVQPRDPLPRGAFVPNVLAGLVPVEPFLADLPVVGGPATDALFLDPDPPEATDYAFPFGVAVLFGEGADRLTATFRDRYDLPAGEDSRPDFDPY